MALPNIQMCLFSTLTVPPSRSTHRHLFTRPTPRHSITRPSSLAPSPSLASCPGSSSRRTSGSVAISSPAWPRLPSSRTIRSSSLERLDRAVSTNCYCRFNCDLKKIVFPVDGLTAVRATGLDAQKMRILWIVSFDDYHPCLFPLFGRRHYRWH